MKVTKEVKEGYWRAICMDRQDIRTDCLTNSEVLDGWRGVTGRETDERDEKRW